jgi:hypothetical protein
VHYLRKCSIDKFVLPEENEFAAMPLQCYVCESTNVYRLGFLTNPRGQAFIACRTPCARDALLSSRGVTPDTFQSIIANGSVLEHLVRVPRPDQYSKVPMVRAIAVNQAIRERLGEADDASAGEG